MMDLSMALNLEEERSIQPEAAREVCDSIKVKKRDPVTIERLLNLEEEARADQSALNGRTVIFF
jgi:hypothetical protein